MLQAYKQKYLIEAAFREMKTILKLRPWFVYKEEHIRAHYTICVLAYLLERLLDIKLEEKDCKNDGWTVGKLKDDLQKYKVVELKIGDSKKILLQKTSESLAQLLKKIDMSTILKLK